LIALLLAWGTAIAQGAGRCPPVSYPPGVDVGAGDVEATLAIDPEGRVASASEWRGPEELVAAVESSLAECRFDPGPALVPYAWRFSEPPVNVAGFVRARGTRDPVSNVTVVVGERSTRTAADGSFELRNVAPGDLTVRVVDPAWHLTETTLHVSPGERSDLELWVGVETERNELVATYTPLGESGVVRTVQVDAAKGIPGSLGDPLRALSGQPGLARTPFDAGWLLVRGGDYDETGVYLDGVRTPLAYHLGGFTSVLHPEMIDEVRFYPGLFPARYGNAISGAVDLVPRPVGDRTYVVGGVNVVFAHAFVETPTPFGGIAVAARRSYLDGAMSLVLGPQDASIAPRFWDAQARATIGKTSVMVIGSADAIDAPSFSGEGILEIDQDAFQAQAVMPIGKALAVRPWIAWTRRDVEGDVTPQAVEEWYPGMRVEGRSPSDSLVRATGGMEVQRRAFHLERGEAERDAPLWTLEPYAGAGIGTTLSAWTDVRLLGVVVESDPNQPARAALSPRAGLSVSPTDAVAIHAEFGRLHQLPPPTLMLGLSEGIYLDLERSDQVAGGFRLAARGITFDSEVWARRSFDLAEIETDGTVGTAEARAHGVETKVGFRREGFQGSVLYQYTSSDKREDPDDAWGVSAFETPHRLEMLVIQDLAKRWSVSGRFRLTSGYPRLEDEEGNLAPTIAYDLLDDRAETIDISPTDDRLAPYHSLDLRVAKVFAFRTWELETALDLQNVYSYRTVEPVITGFGETRPSYGQGLMFLPVFSVEGRFWPGQPREP
jgi:hypothetical protein